MAENTGKICGICGQDCAGQPRTKDRQGNYYHQTCYDKAVVKRQSMVEPPPLVGAGAADSDQYGLMSDLLDDLPSADDGRTCPGCGGPLDAGAVVCMTCGFNRTTGASASVKVKKARAAPPQLTGSIKLLVSPAVVSLAVLLFFGIFFAMATGNEDAGVAYVSLASVFYLGILVTAVVFAFKESVGTGLLTLCVPCYILYFVFGVCENPYVKFLYPLAILVNLLTLAVELPPGFELTGEFGR